jgi:uncharacterized repeat protein (TIGR01451 family)
VACCLAAALACALPARAQRAADRCSELGEASRIEVLDLPFRDTVDTCLGFHDTVAGFGEPCSVFDVTYGGPDAIYEVRLHEGNRVAFHLDVAPPADLVLVLLRTCGDGSACETSSPDFIGSGDEELPSRHYEPGVYYLYVDSATGDSIGRCGAYTLTVEGTNPVPDLQVSLSASPRPVIAGTALTYILAVSNAGTLAATGVMADLQLPGGTTLERADAGCTRRDARTVRCTIGDLPVGASESRRVTVQVSASARGTLSARVEARANEGLPKRADALTDVEARTDLSLTLSARPAPVVAGTDVTYQVEVTNGGPSDSAGGEVVDDLPRGLSFVSSSSGCTAERQRVRCPFGPFPAGGRQPLSFAARVAPSVTGSVSNRATVISADPDPVPGNDGSGLVETLVSVAADLELSVTPPPVPVVAGTDLEYRLSVVNRGPSDSAGGRLLDTLPRRVEPGPLPPGCVEPGPPHQVVCAVPRLTAGGRHKVALTGRVAPAASSPIVNRARVEGADDPEAGNDARRTETPVEVQADLRLVQLAPAQVFRGANALYRFRITNHGPSRFPGGTLAVEFVPPVSFVSSPNDCQAGGSPGRVTCPVDAVPLESSRRVALVARVPAEPGTAADVESTATLDSQGADPDPEAPTTSTSSILARPDLVLPYFEVTRDPQGPVALWAVENLSAESATVRYDYFDADGTPLAFEEPRPLAGKQVRTVSLRDVEGVAGAGPAPTSGYAWITRTDTDDPGQDGLAGDFFRIDPAATGSGPASVSGGALVATDPMRVPPELCHLWSVRFSSAEPFTGGTDFVFWLTPSPSEVTVLGSVYDDAGTFDRTVAIRTTEASFTRSLGELEEALDDGTFAPASLPASGAVDWELPEGFVGNASTVHRGEGFAIGVPGICRDGREHLPGTDLPLVLPYFNLGVEPETTFVVRNEGDRGAQVTFRYFAPAGGDPVLEEVCHLGARTVRRAALLDLGSAGPEPCECRAGDEDVPCALPPDLTSGFATIQVTRTDPGDPDEPEAPVFLSGSYFRIDRAAGLGAGEALVDPEPTLVPPQLCHCWATRLIDGGGLSTDFVFYAPDPDGSVIEGAFYEESGGAPVAGFQIPREQVAFQVRSGELPLEPPVDFGSIEWTFPPERPGHVSTLFLAPGGYSVLIPGVCLDKPSPEH